MCWGSLPLFGELARRHLNTRIVIDHVGMIQPFMQPALTGPFSDLANVISLAVYET